MLCLHDIAGDLFKYARTSQNGFRTLVGLLRQSGSGRLTEYGDVNNANLLALDPVMWEVVGGLSVDTKAASVKRGIVLGRGAGGD